MPHQCVHCGKLIEVGSREIIEGCSNCSGKFFFYVRDEQVPNLQEGLNEGKPLMDMSTSEKKNVEKDVRSILKIKDEEKPVILDLESVRANGPGKYELDLVSLLNRKPIIFKLEEGKYIIDIESGL
jgi:predicted  nucleic acid-binding Zn-ribbon protein